jgi:hypothetical protein
MQKPINEQREKILQIAARYGARKRSSFWIDGQRRFAARE